MDLNLNLEKFVPPLWARSGHAQTLLPHFLPSEKLKQAGKRLEIALPDGDTLVARYHEGDSNTVLHLFHGLTGDIEASYIQRVTRQALARGHSVLRVNHRGCGEGYGLARLPYHSGRGEDVSESIRLGRQMFPTKRHVAIGFSLGGNAVLSLMAGIRGEHQADAAIAVNPPIDLGSVARSLEQGFNRAYDLNFVLALRSMVKKMRGEGLLDRDFAIPLRTTLRDFDDIYTAPTGGFTSGEDYYATCSTWNRMDRIERPTVVLTAKDDPIVIFDPFAKAKYSSSVELHAEDFGGHLGYLSRAKTPLGSYRWLDYAVDAYIQALSE